jgi:hypothetical protein
MLKLYPDFGKATKEYASGLIEVFAGYSPRVQRSILKTIPEKCKFLPTIADFAEHAAPLIAEDYRIEESAKRIAEARAKDDGKPYHATGPVYYDHAPFRYEWQREQSTMAKVIDIKALEVKRKRMMAYVLEIGRGDAVAGWQRCMDAGINEPPPDWQATP